MPILDGKEWSREKPVAVEHEGNRGIRIGEWKLVAEWDGPWELYNIPEDRTEQHDYSSSEPERVASMIREYEVWAERCGVLPWPVKEGFLAKRTLGKRDHISQHRSPIGGRTFR